MIPPITGTPTYESIMDVLHPLNVNDASVHSKLGGGPHLRHLLPISPDMFATLLTTTFIPPGNPGPTPVIPGNQNGSPNQQNPQRRHKESLTALAWL
jgi:hypothetical protein